MKPTTRKVKFGQKAAHVSFTGEWDGVYTIATHGRSEIDVAADVNALQLHHEKKSARMSGFAGSMAGRSLKVKGQSFTVTDCTIRERGTNVELYVSVIDADGVRPLWMPIRKVYNTVDDVPDDQTILDMLAGVITAELANMAAESSKISRLKLQFGDTP